MTARWYALYSKPRKERVLWRQLKEQGYEVFYPRVFLPTHNSQGLKCKSFFPRYMFVKVDFGAVSLSTFKWMPHTEGLVCIDGIPAYIPDRIIEAIQGHLDRINTASERISQSLQKDGLKPEEYPIDISWILASDLTEKERVHALLKTLNKMRVSPELSSC